MTKCPKCENLVTHVQLTQVNISAGTNSWKGVTYCCPFCFSVLSVGIDPVALKTDTIYEVTQEIKQLQKEVEALRNQVARLEQICAR